MTVLLLCCYSPQTFIQRKGCYRLCRETTVYRFTVEQELHARMDTWVNCAKRNGCNCLKHCSKSTSCMLGWTLVSLHVTSGSPQASRLWHLRKLKVPTASCTDCHRLQLQSRVREADLAKPSNMQCHSTGSVCSFLTTPTLSSGMLLSCQSLNP